MKMLTAEELKQILDSEDEVLLIDVRTPEEFEQGRIPGAFFIPTEALLDAEDIDEAKLAGLAEAASAAGIADISTSTRIIPYCYSGVRSAEVALHLQDIGFSAVTPFTGVVDWPYGFVV